MFTVIWDTRAFEQMHALILWHPSRRVELAAALQTIDGKLHAQADGWGESRDPPFRLAFVGELAVLFRVSTEERVAEIVEVRLNH